MKPCDVPEGGSLRVSNAGAYSESPSGMCLGGSVDFHMSPVIVCMLVSVS
jgi:hypothetical protein